MTLQLREELAAMERLLMNVTKVASLDERKRLVREELSLSRGSSRGSASSPAKGSFAYRSQSPAQTLLADGNLTRAPGASDRGRSPGVRKEEAFVEGVTNLARCVVGAADQAMILRFLREIVAQQEQGPVATHSDPPPLSPPTRPRASMTLADLSSLVDPQEIAGADRTRFDREALTKIHQKVLAVVGPMEAHTKRCVVEAVYKYDGSEIRWNEKDLLIDIVEILGEQ